MEWPPRPRHGACSSSACPASRALARRVVGARVAGRASRAGARDRPTAGAWAGCHSSARWRRPAAHARPLSGRRPAGRHPPARGGDSTAYRRIGAIRAPPSRTRGGLFFGFPDPPHLFATLPHAGGTGGMRRTNRARGNHTGSGCGARPAARVRPTRRSWRWRIRGWGAPGGGTPSGRSRSIPSRGAWRPERGIDARAWGAPCSMRPRGWRARWPWRGGQVMRNRGRRSSSVRPRRGMLRGMPCAVGTWRASANRHRWAGTGAAVR